MFDKRLDRVKVLDPSSPNTSTRLVGGTASGIIDTNDLYIPNLKMLYDSQVSCFWRPEEVNLVPDVADFHDKLTEDERVVYKRSLAMLATLDGPQARYCYALAAYFTDPMASLNLGFQGFMESIHEVSYSSMFSTVLNKREQVAAFEDARTDKLIIERNKPIEDCYNNFISNPTLNTLVKSLVHSMILESLNFHSSGFTTIYNFARKGMMTNSASIISFINRDEIIHLRLVSTLLRVLFAEHPELNNQDFVDYVHSSVKNMMVHEMKWVQDLYAKVDFVPMSDIEGYCKYRVNKVFGSVGLNNIYPGFEENTFMPWVSVYEMDETAKGAGTKTDFFESRVTNYRTTSEANGFDDL